MCDAFCDEINTYHLSTPLQPSSIEVSFADSNGIEDSIQLQFDGIKSNGSAQNLEVSVEVTSDTIRLYSSFGLILEAIEIQINETTVSSELSNSAQIELCDSVCTHNSYNINTNNIEYNESNITILEDFDYIISCTTSIMGSVGDLTIVASNENHTNALIVHEINGYDVHGGGYWENGFNNPNLMVELHVGTNVGYNYCTDNFVDEDIEELFVPINYSELPEDIPTDAVIDFNYGPNYPDCEDCVPYAMLYVENFWFRSELGNYAKIEIINHLQSDILFSYGG